MLKGKNRHELSCSACGAPLHDLKMLRKDREGARELVPPSRVRHSEVRKPKPTKPPKRSKRKKRKGLMSKIFEEAFDVIEDIFD